MKCIFEIILTDLGVEVVPNCILFFVTKSSVLMLYDTMSKSALVLQGTPCLAPRLWQYDMTRIFKVVFWKLQYLASVFWI